MRFAKSTGCFYPESELYSTLPADIITVPQEDFDAAMARNPGDTLNVVGGRVVIIPKPAATKAELQAAARNGIKAERDRRKAGGIEVGAKWFHSDDGSRIQQIGLVMTGASIPAGLQWKTMDGSFITMTQALATSVFGAAAASDQVIFGAAETHRVAMEASADPASYDYSGGWPKVYGE